MRALSFEYFLDLGRLWIKDAGWPPCVALPQDPRGLSSFRPRSLADAALLIIESAEAMAAFNAWIRNAESEGKSYCEDQSLAESDVFQTGRPIQLKDQDRWALERTIQRAVRRRAKGRRFGGQP